MGASNNDTIFLKPVTIDEVVNITCKLNNKTSKDCFGLSMYTVKKLIIPLSVPLSYICNLSLENVFFPKMLKTAKVIPMHKSGTLDDFNNYRPISLLPQFSKILEKVFYNRLLVFTEKHKIVHESQFGFRPKYSTTYAVSELIECISEALENKSFTLGLFIDLKKAFDTVNHAIFWKN